MCVLCVLWQICKDHVPPSHDAAALTLAYVRQTGLPKHPDVSPYGKCFFFYNKYVTPTLSLSSLHDL